MEEREFTISTDSLISTLPKLESWIPHIKDFRLARICSATLASRTYLHYSLSLNFLLTSLSSANLHPSMASTFTAPKNPFKLPKELQDTIVKDALDVALASGPTVYESQIKSLALTSRTFSQIIRETVISQQQHARCDLNKSMADLYDTVMMKVVQEFCLRAGIFWHPLGDEELCDEIARRALRMHYMLSAKHGIRPQIYKVQQEEVTKWKMQVRAAWELRALWRTLKRARQWLNVVDKVTSSRTKKASRG